MAESFLVTLAKGLVEHVLGKVIDELPGATRRVIEGDPEKKKALGRAFAAGFEAALKAMNPPDANRGERYAGLLKRLLSQPDAVAEYAKLVDLRNVTLDPTAVVDIDKLDVLFRKEYEADKYPEAYEGLNFQASMKAFVEAYAGAVKMQPDKLPWVNTGYFDTMLERLDALPRIEKKLKELTGETKNEQAILAYLECLRTRCGYLPLRGVDIGSSDPTAQQKRMELARVYVDLDTKTAVPVEKEGKERKERVMLPERETRPLPALEATIANHCLVLLGDPGSGKSTFVSHVGLCLASHRLEPNAGWLARLPGWPDKDQNLIPIYVTLRDFARSLPADKKKPDMCLLSEFIVKRLEAENLQAAQGPLLQALEEGRAVLLLDGLDEVPTADQRTFIRDVVAAFLGRYKRCRALVTCRTLSYQDKDKAWQLPDVPSFELAPFDEGKINRFIDAWYAELGRLGAVRPEDTGALAGRLREAVRRPDLWQLAPNPLLLSVMALVHTHKGRLPDARAMLYEDTVDILLWRWEQLKIVGEGEQPQLRQLLLEAGRSDVDLKRVLWELAFEAHKGGGAADKDALADIPEMTLVTSLAKLHPANDYGWAQKVVEQIKERAGLLLERQPGAFAFPHRTFQEYLAGGYLSAQADFAKQAAALVSEGAFWREVILLAVGRLVYLSGDMDKPLALAAELCPGDAPDEGLLWRKAWLAGDVLLEIGLSRVRDSAHGRELAERIPNRLADLVSHGSLTPVERAAAGRTLAKLGDTRRGVAVSSNGLPDILWCEVPKGEFRMGQGKEEHTVALPDFYISRFPITQRQFQAFTDAGGYAVKAYWTEAEKAGVWTKEGVKGRWDEKPRVGPTRYGESFDLPSHPAVGITWYEALAFCRWLDDQRRLRELPMSLWEDGKIVPFAPDPKWSITLPSEEEWEKAARGTDGRIYPWIGDADPYSANYNETGIGMTSAVGCFPQGVSPYGAEDMSGNVWEWTRSAYGPYPYESKRENLSAPKDTARVLRGGSFNYEVNYVRCAYRFGSYPYFFDWNLGFRLVLSPVGL
jgi:formylglycine-generating enzyme required for sulfatase activity